MDHVEIAGRRIGPGEPVYIVVEAGTTANGDLETAKHMIEASKEAGADVIKFQFIGADYFMSNKDVTYEYEAADGKHAENMYEMFKNLELSLEQWQEVVAYCDKVDIPWFASVDYVPGVDLGEQLDAPAYKLSSWDTANMPLIRKMAQTGKPVVVDTGPTYMVDLVKLVDVIRAEGNDQIILIHCSHAKMYDGLNLRSIPYMQDALKTVVGFSADERNSAPDIASVALGACVLEKRLTLNKDFSGHHHLKALEPDEFKDYVKLIREIEQMQGERAIIPSEEDLRQRQLYYVSIVAQVDIPAGTCITEKMLACKRPGHGIMPEFLDVVVGRKTMRDIRANELVTWDDI